MKALKGAAGAPGIAVGRLVHFRPVLDDELAPFPVLVERATGYLHRLGEQLRADGLAAEAAILDAQALLVADSALEAAVRAHIAEGWSMAAAIGAAIDGLATPLEALDDTYLRERAADVRAAGAALLRADRPEPIALPPGAILVADELMPADLVSIPRSMLAGLATARGAVASHTTILARSLGIPAALGLGAAGLDYHDGTVAIVDGAAATLIVEPDRATVSQYVRRQHERSRPARAREPRVVVPASTVDGRRVLLWANIAGAADVAAAIEEGAEGVGLFRTEFLYFGRSAPPTEDEQAAIYAEVLTAMDGRPVVIRTLDAGGDKALPYLPLQLEPNPALGERGIRLSQRFPPFFQAQVRAMLRAAVMGDLRVMLPMVTTLADVQWAREQIATAARDLADAGIVHRAGLPLGIMIETPAAAVMADCLAPEVDFF
ncbi:MAG TPA: putative PEP-binding protein, partial [Herpetosiphonaceae bacterium]|nr:putative PEP-binding protein [Herpetosiphonaceae bacterium]